MSEFDKVATCPKSLKIQEQAARIDELEEAQRFAIDRLRHSTASQEALAYYLNKVISRRSAKVYEAKEGYTLMPEELTSENGAKTLLIGEFHETITLQCNECGGEGEIEEEVCDECGGAGSHNYKVPVSWTTTKEIYAMAVKHLALANLEQAKGEVK